MNLKTLRNSMLTRTLSQDLVLRKSQDKRSKKEVKLKRRNKHASIR